jgi:hypothetical protein
MLAVFLVAVYLSDLHRVTLQYQSTPLTPCSLRPTGCCVLTYVYMAARGDNAAVYSVKGTLLTAFCYYYYYYYLFIYLFIYFC